MRIIKVEYLADYKLRLTFSNKKIRVVDLESKIKDTKGIFLPLKDPNYFKKAMVDDCQLSICWPNGADMCPDMFYEMGKPSKTSIKAERKKPRKKRKVVISSKKKMSHK